MCKSDAFFIDKLRMIDSIHQVHGLKAKVTGPNKNRSMSAFYISPALVRSQIDKTVIYL
jgi:hypothetical protein